MSYIRIETRIGQKFGRLTLLKKGQQRDSGLFRCECGAIKEIPGSPVFRGCIQSCGCLYGRNGNRVHGKSTSKEFEVTYNRWRAMKNRCNNPNSKCYQHYGGRGIKVCQRWEESFDAFLDDMGKVPTGMTIERKDNSKGYSPENCKWATWSEQKLNQRKTLFIEIDGQRMHIREACERLGLKYSTAVGRINRGIPLTAPLRTWPSRS